MHSVSCSETFAVETNRRSLCLIISSARQTMNAETAFLLPNGNMKKKILPFLKISIWCLLVLIAVDYALFRYDQKNAFFTLDEIVPFKGIPRGILGTDVKNPLNNLGYNDVDINLDETIQSRFLNIQFVGDSVLMAQQVPRGQNLVSLVQSQPALSGKIRVHNFGVLGYDFDASFKNYLKFKNLLKPEYVLYFFCVNDFLTENEQRIIDENINSRWFMHRQGSGILNWIIKTIPQKRYRDYAKDNEVDVWYSDKSNHSPESAALEKFAQRMQEFKAETGGNFAVVIVPPRQVVYENLEAEFLDRKLPELLQQKGIVFYSMSDFFKRRFAENKVDLFADPVHFNETGHRLAADFLKPILEGIAKKMEK